ncbi:unnamed protein product [Thlaspi arvense]|uniref:RING-type E3 ubiquitin transferase n=1 Tax=Thlaspi arvense TaxID=13288 RepID=A0AAU9RA87_THLAR|nr:unnamed protein product [Thlaspi arvense]
MQGERASLGSLSETLNFEHGSTSINAAVMDQQIRWENIHNLGDNQLHDYMIPPPATTTTTFPISVSHEQRDLHRFSLGEASSSGVQWMQMGRFEERRNDKPELNPSLFMQRPSGNRVVRNVNLNAEYNEHLVDMNQVTGPPGVFQVNGPENSVRAGSSVDGRRVSVKRKAIDAGIGQPSSSGGGFREFHSGEGSAWVSAPPFYSPPSNDLNISLDHGPRGLVSQSRSPASSITGNFSVRVNPNAQQETVSPAAFSPGSGIRRQVAPASRLPRPDQQPIDTRDQHFAPQNPNASAIPMPHVTRTMMPPFQWSVPPVAAGGSSSSSAPTINRNVVPRVETRQRSNIPESPLFGPPPEMMNLSHSHVAASSSSRTSVQPSPPVAAALNPHQGYSPASQRRLSSARSLLTSLASNHRAARSFSVRPVSQDQQMLQPDGDNTFQAQNRAYSRASSRQVPTAVGIPHSLRGLASTSRGRSRPASSEIRNVLDHMRRTGNLRMEDVMLLTQMGLGGADIHDRYRGMRLDVDNMTYEELLSLEERIGDVCTGLSDETISSRLKQRKYNSGTKAPQEVEPCCICQEEYNEGEEVGKLDCGHEFHCQCIKEWLKVKNLCPICKTTGLNTAEKPIR